ncbi:2-amino-4-hydroxy-6-hydroxymethyldihydropteridine diphosphokinase [Hyphobacterium sp.]|jgi:2-amino-4-hydroxy-6-hydroxymethyldihydropteridine diphosphokinase|uniref:2-amino-4-hydroxy-6- hydroxymethyldihydropteridine diphosphokinase n=1 Tax=Hyphobacterium sp. TaxID=2004662 RepID=UPI003BAD9024
MSASGAKYIALGANLPFEGGVPQDTLLHALQALAERGITNLAVSGLWRSPAWPDARKPDYINAVAEIETGLPPESVLDHLLAVEAQFGRIRRARWDSRTLDLDLIDYGGRIETGARLTLPHPRATVRAFVLLPLQDIAPDWRDPVSGQSLSSLIAALPEADRSATRRLSD